MTTVQPPFTATSIDELTDEQVNNLTDEQVDRLIKRAMAEQGIPIYPVPVEPDYEPVPGPDMSIYEVAGEHFNDRDAAEEIQQVIHRHAAARVRLAYGRDYNVRYVETNDIRVDVTTKMAYSPATHAQHKTALEENAGRKKAYDSEKSAYQDAERKASEIRARIHDRMEDVRERTERAEMLAHRFLEYRSIANGDDLMAMQFLVKAFDLTDEQVAAVRSHPLVVEREA